MTEMLRTPIATASLGGGEGTLGRGSAATGSLIEALLDEQGDLTAVERFAQYHEDADEPLQRRFYSALLPASPPGPGQQLAFEVDLDRCSGCKACVVACHALNGLDEGEAWREVGLIVGGPSALPVLQHVTSSCHHCLDPACLNACPVDAYEKDPATGIVKHLDDQCFGCQYCTLACPYDAPKFHARKGIVRKCDMCADRLRAGEAPACVQACPHEAIRIRVVDRDEVVDRAERGEFLASAPDPGGTRPTTRYVSESALPDAMLPADHFRCVPEHAHWPLVIMLVLTQLSVGGFLVDLVVQWAGGAGSLARIGLSLAFGLLGLAASTYHLGRPLLAYRALIGLRHSWLSREVATLGLFAALAQAHVGLSVSGPEWYQQHPGLRAALSLAVVLAGASGVASSVMVYHVVRRPYWRAPSSAIKFAGSGLVLGLAVSLVAASLDGTPPWASRAMGLGLMALVGAKLGYEALLFLHLKDPGLTPLRRSALLMRGPLARQWLARLASGLWGGIALALLLTLAWSSLTTPVRGGFAILAFASLLAGEVLERYLFFAAVTKPKMPGGLLP